MHRPAAAETAPRAAAVLPRVVVLAASPLLRSGLVAALADGDAWIVGAVGAQADELDAANGHGGTRTALLVAAVGADARAAAALYEAWAGSAGLVLLGEHLQPVAARALAERRAIAALPLAASAPQLRAAVTAVLAGLHVGDADALVPPAPQRGAAPAPAGEPPGEPLTPRELEVFELVAKGLSNRDIAGALGISEHTAKFHVGQILAKSGAATRAEAVGIGLRLGLIGV